MKQDYPKAPSYLDSRQSCPSVTGSCRKIGSGLLTGNRTTTVVNEKPAITDFENFFPWLCLQCEVPYKVTVKKVIQGQ